MDKTMTTERQPQTSGVPLAPLEEKFAYALEQLEQAPLSAKFPHQSAVIELGSRILLHPDGLDCLYRYAPRFDAAGLFSGSDWAEPGVLLPSLVSSTLENSPQNTVVLDCLSHLRMLAMSNNLCSHAGVSAEQAHNFLTQVLALNLSRLFGTVDETLRTRLGDMAEAVCKLFRYLLDHIGFENILGGLIDEINRILAQRPLQVASVKAMVSQLAITLSKGAGDIGDARLGADRLISALFGPTQGCQDDPGLEVYRSRLDAMDAGGLQQEAYSFSRAMHDVGLVSDYHAVFLPWLLENGHEYLISDALGLSSTGLDSLRSYQDLNHELIRQAIFPETAQAVYGFSLMLERGLLYASPIAPALWRQLGMQLSPRATELLGIAFGNTRKANVHLLAGVIELLGQPLGVGQGANPTCQSARAISMWAFNDPDYLLHLVAQAACFDSIMMHFEGTAIASADLPVGLARTLPLDTDPVSVLLVPHLDRVYNEMGRLCDDRGEDAHRWINPEFHGWWVGRQFLIAVDVQTGRLHHYDIFLAQFYRSYNPLYNGNQPVIHPQPAGVAVTDSSARFVGWHAITLIRVGLDQTGTMRVYFYNPNNDSGQNWGNEVIVSTQGFGERFGESSLPFAQLASRLYIFHDDPIVQATSGEIPRQELEEVKQMATNSWAQERLPLAL